ncbi:MAG: hypothetical protein ACLFWF_04995 [Alphaproteobacteria bacterium]
MDLTPEPRFLHGFTPIASARPEIRPRPERKNEGPERRLQGWLYQGVPALFGATVLSWGALLNTVTEHAHPVRMAAWSLLLLAAVLAVGVMWRSLRTRGRLRTLAEWGAAHRSGLWVLGFAWGAAAFLVVPHMAQPAPVYAWFLVPLGGVVMAVPCAADWRAGLAAGLPPLLMTLLALSFKGAAMMPVALAVAGAGLLSAALMHAVHRLVRERAETAARLGPAPALFSRS